MPNQGVSLARHRRSTQYQEVRTAVLERDGMRCRICVLSVTDVNLTTQHEDYGTVRMGTKEDGYREETAACVRLCVLCHATMAGHRGK